MGRISPERAPLRIPLSATFAITSSCRYSGRMLSLTCERSRIRQDYGLGRRQQVFRNSPSEREERPTSKPETHKFWLFSAFLVCVFVL